MGATVTVLDINIDKLRQLDAEFCGRIHTRYSSAYELEGAVKRADLIGATGARRQGTQISLEFTYRAYRAGAVLVDIAIDPGRLFRRLTTDHLRPPTFAVRPLFCCVANMPPRCRRRRPTR